MAIEIVDFPIKMVIFHSYVSLPEGMLSFFDNSGGNYQAGGASKMAESGILSV